ETTRRKKIDEFRRGFDKSVMNTDDKPSVPVAKSMGGPDTQRTSATRQRHKNNEINSYSDSDTKKRIEKDSKKALKEQSKKEKRIEKNKAKRNQKMFKWVWLCMVVIIGIVLSQVILVGVNDLLAIEREKDPITVKISIPADPTIEDIATILEENDVIDNAKYFTLYANLTTDVDNFRQGEFEMETDKDYEAIVNYLQSNINRTDIVKVQLTEGMNIVEIASKLHEEGVVSDVQEFLDVCKSDEFDEDFDFLVDLPNAKDRYYKLEGYLFPDTYDFYLNEDPKTIIEKFLYNYEDKVYATKDKYNGRKKSATIEELIAESDYSVDEVLTIASIIQAEAANIEDMYYISSILHNRLEYGSAYGVGKLNCDCTVYYPYREYEDVPTTIRDSYSSSYNTNIIDGLPMGPICNPGMDAILAAIDPYDTDYLFFCHSSAENGSTPYYASTNADHEYNLTLID
ncbi:MAG: endolytic transglycosylase MltG, partial [Ruminococcus sp.]|nr:endolytic transglycosylase MltG [Ruminococcus sp.]